MRYIPLLILLPTLCYAEPRTPAPTTVSVTLELNAEDARALAAWVAMVAERGAPDATPQGQALLLLREGLANIERATLQAEAQRQADARVRDRAAAHSVATREWWKRLRAAATKALDAQPKQP